MPGIGDLMSGYSKRLHGYLNVKFIVVIGHNNTDGYGVGFHGSTPHGRIRELIVSSIIAVSSHIIKIRRSMKKETGKYYGEDSLEMENIVHIEEYTPTIDEEEWDNDHDHMMNVRTPIRIDGDMDLVCFLIERRDGSMAFSSDPNASLEANRDALCTALAMFSGGT